ncbi:MAG: DUF2934 domain-containing protein [Burkholderiales bacterium]|nr:DUF2934 domain-containing protein [Burkholderiales bacterium]
MRKPRTHAGSKAKTAGQSTDRLKEKTPSTDEERHDAAACNPRTDMTAEERHGRIAEASYYRAMRRGFHGGSDLEDWLESEAEIDKLIWHG